MNDLKIFPKIQTETLSDALFAFACYKREKRYVLMEGKRTGIKQSPKISYRIVSYISVIRERHCSCEYLTRSVLQRIRTRRISDIRGALQNGSTHVEPPHVRSLLSRSNRGHCGSIETVVSDAGKTYARKFIGYSEMNSAARSSLHIHGFCLRRVCLRRPAASGEE